jgi:hypothetical protein
LKSGIINHPCQTSLKKSFTLEKDSLFQEKPPPPRRVTQVKEEKRLKSLF